MENREEGNQEYAVAWPLGRRMSAAIDSPGRGESLDGKTVCELWDLMFRGEEMYPLIREALRKRYPSVKFVDHTVFGNTHGAKQNELVAALPALLKQHGCDVVISGVGA